MRDQSPDRHRRRTHGTATGPANRRGTRSVDRARRTTSTWNHRSGHTARYHVSYRGLSGGEIESSFRHGQQPACGSTKRVYPNLFGRIALSAQAREVSTIQVSSSGVRPLSFSFNDGAKDRQKDVKLDYDWAAGKLTGVAEGKPIAFELVPGVQDTASVQAAMIRERLAGRRPQSFKIVTGGKLREYRYWMEGTQQVMTPFGQLEAEVWATSATGRRESRRSGTRRRWATCPCRRSSTARATERR